MKRPGFRLSPYLRGETKTQESVDLRRCRLVPVLRAETNTLKIVEMRRCRLSPYLRGETKTQDSVEIRVCVGRSWGVPHNSPKVAIFTQGACLQFATFWRPPPTLRISFGKCVFTLEMTRGSFQTCFQGRGEKRGNPWIYVGVVSCLF